MATKRRGLHGHTTKTSQSKIARADETTRALNLKRRGMSIRDISRIMDISIGKAHGLVVDGLKQIPEFERAALTMDIVDREYGLIKAHWPLRKEPDHAKVIQASHKLLVSVFGLEAPTKSEVTAIVGAAVTPADARKVMSEMFGGVGPGDKPPTIE